MNPLPTLLAVVAAGLIVAGCGPHRAHHRAKVVRVHHTHDGRYVYQSDDGLFWFYMYRGGLLVDPTLTMPPSGGTWVTQPLSDASRAELQVEVGTTPATDQAISVNDDGSPLSAAQVELEGRDGVDVSETGESAAEASSGESGGSDPGGGGDPI